jgi:hypothetical protein
LWVKSRQNLVEEIKEPTSIASKLQQDSIERIKCFKNEANVPFVDQAIQENVFFFSFYKKVMKRKPSPSYYFKDMIEFLPTFCSTVIFLTFTWLWQHSLAFKFIREKLKQLEFLVSSMPTTLQET